MNLKRIFTIFSKDVQTSIRNAQILIALLVPVGLGLAHNTLLPDTTKLPAVSLVYSAPDTTRLPSALRAVTARAVRLDIKRLATPAEVRRQVDKEKATVGLVIPPGFDRALRSGGGPGVTVILRGGSESPASYAAAAVESAALRLASGKPLLSVHTQVLSAPKGTVTQIYDEVGARAYGVLGAIVLLIAMISVYIVPLMLTEEAEKKTLDAMAMIASYGEIIGAKALVGLAYVGVTIPVLLLMTRLTPVDIVRFGLGMGLLAVTLVGLGLFLGGLFRTSAQVNTWSTLLLLPFVIAAVLVGYDLPKLVGIFLAVVPSSHAMQLATDGLTGRTYYGNSWASVLVLLAWGIAAYGLLWWRLQRREA
jgi:ABC-2 type transport system permease protein